MKAIRDFLHNLRAGALFKTAPNVKVSHPPRVEFSYTIYWTKHVRQWDATRRRAVRDALRQVLAQPGFEANAYERRYSVPGLDEQAHSGASLIALKKVIAAFNDESTGTGQ